MSITDLRLEFASEFGHSLDWANHMADNGCQKYIKWLEEKIEILERAARMNVRPIVEELFKEFVAQ